MDIREQLRNQIYDIVHEAHVEYDTAEAVARIMELFDASAKLIHSIGQEEGIMQALGIREKTR